MAFSSGAFSEVPFATNSGSPFSSTVLELASGTDSVSTLSVGNGIILELATALDTPSTLIDGYGNIVETVTAADTIPTNITGFSAVIETATGSDNINGRFLWNEVNNTSSTTWIDIPTM